MAAIAYYNEVKNIIYVTTGTKHSGQELKDFEQPFLTVVRSALSKTPNVNLIMDVTPIDLSKYNNYTREETDLPNGYETKVIRNHCGSGKVVLVVDAENGSTPMFQEYYTPDGICRSVEDAEYFIEHGDGVDRGPTEW